MELRDYSQKLDKARDKYREAQSELRGSYEKNLDEMKETFANKTKEQSKTYDAQKTKLEEQNAINNEEYSKKSEEAIEVSQQDFKNRIRENVSKFDKEKNATKNKFDEKLSNISQSYKKSFDENDRFHDQIKKSMGERYKNANKRYQEDFNNKVTSLDERSRERIADLQEYDREERIAQTNKFNEEMQNLRASSSEQKFKEVSRLRDDNENLRTTYDREKSILKEQQDNRVADLFKIKEKENIDGQKNYKNLQQNIRQKNINMQEKEQLAHKRESKELENKYNEDLRVLQRVTNQKVKGGTQADNLKDELEQTKTSYENRLQTARDEMNKANRLSNEKEETIDQTYRDKMREVKAANVELLARKDGESSDLLNKTVQTIRDRNNSIIERYKNEAVTAQNDGKEKLNVANEKGAKRYKDQRVELGKAINTINEKNMETIAGLKDEYSRDKTQYIERTKKDINEEKVLMKNDFNRTSAMRDSLYEQKLMDLEKQTEKIVENYENRISQILRKSEKEIESLKSNEEERKFKEGQAFKVAMENQSKESQIEMAQMRDKYERVIAKDRITSEQLMNRVVQKYEDQLGRERSEHQKETSVRLAEAQAQFERLYKGSELEKATLKAQYEQRMENMRLASLEQQSRVKKS